MNPKWTLRVCVLIRCWQRQSVYFDVYVHQYSFEKSFFQTNSKRYRIKSIHFPRWFAEPWQRSINVPTVSTQVWILFMVTTCSTTPIFFSQSSLFSFSLKSLSFNSSLYVFHVFFAFAFTSFFFLPFQFLFFFKYSSPILWYVDYGTNLTLWGGDSCRVKIVSS